MKARFQEANLRTKIIVIIMATVFIVLTFSGAILLAAQIQREKARLQQSTSAVAEVITSNSTAALTFRDIGALKEILSSLSRRQSLLAACIFDSRGELMGSYTQSGKTDLCTYKPVSSTEASFQGRNLHLRAPIILEQKVIGDLYMVSDLREMYHDIQSQVWITVIVLILAALIAYAVSQQLERLVSAPILDLADVARAISEKRDFSIRVKKKNEDEVANLIDALNYLLSQVESQNRERERLLNEAREAIHVRDDFMSIASHELRTPLTPLKTQTQLIQKLVETGKLSTFPPDKLRRLVSTTDHQITRLTRLVDDLLDVTRISAGRMTLNLEDVDLSQLVQEVIERFQPEITASGSRVDLHLQPMKPGYWDRLRVEQVIINLLTNALKYGKGNPILISTDIRGESAVILVKDRGLGIAPEDQKRIFDRFGRAVSSRHFGGLGLGLYIVFQIVSAHHGEIQVESAPGVGSTFRIELPFRPNLTTSDLNTSQR